MLGSAKTILPAATAKKLFSLSSTGPILHSWTILTSIVIVCLGAAFAQAKGKLQHKILFPTSSNSYYQTEITSLSHLCAVVAQEVKAVGH